MLALPPPPPAVAGPAVPTPSARYGFADAWMGESLAEWRAGRPLRARAPCTALAAASAVLACRGAESDLGGGYAAREPTYVFVDERLAEISFKTSIDGFAYVTAALKKAFGTPASIVRDSLGRSGFPHESMIWRNGRSTIVLDDPLPDFAHLSVRFTFDALASRLPDAKPHKENAL